MGSKDKDEELALFLDMKRRDKDRLSRSSLGGGRNVGSEEQGMAKTVSHTHQQRKTAADKFLDSENHKSDYDWLLTPPGTPLQMEASKPLINQIMSNAHPVALKSRLTNVQEVPIAKSSATSKCTSLSSRTNSATTANRRPSSGEPTPATRPRSATPTAGRPTLPATTKAPRSSTPTAGRSTLPATTKAPRSSTPTAGRPTLPATTIATRQRSATPTAGRPRSSTPLKMPTAPAMRSPTPTRTIPCSSTPTSRSSDPTSKSSSRSATPARQRSDPSKLPNGRSASVSKAAPTLSKNAASSHCSSPKSKTRPWKPNEMPGFSLDAPPNLRTTLPERPASASRARPGNTSTRSSNNARPRQQSCSPAKGRASAGNASSSKMSVPIKSKVQTKSSDDVNPILMGTKIVERIVNMRKLVPPKQNDHHATLSNSNAKSSSLDGSGFGCSLSKKSLDMALRHMDIRRTVNGNLRPVLTSIPASSVFSVRSGGSTRGRTTSSSDSPLGTRSNASSEPSVNHNPFFADGLESEDSFAGIERGSSSPISQR